MVQGSVRPVPDKGKLYIYFTVQHTNCVASLFHLLTDSVSVNSCILTFIRIQYAAILLLAWFFGLQVLYGQQAPSVFKYLALGEEEGFSPDKPLRFRDILCSRTGLHRFSSTLGLVREKGMEIELILYSGINEDTRKLSRNYLGEDSIRYLTETAGGKIFFVTKDDEILWQPSMDGGFSFAPFVFPGKPAAKMGITALGAGRQNDIYIGTAAGTIYVVRGGAEPGIIDGRLDSSGRFLVTKGAMQAVLLGEIPGHGIRVFQNDPLDSGLVWVGTERGIYLLDREKGIRKDRPPALQLTDSISVTDLKTDPSGNIWFSSRQQGISLYARNESRVIFFQQEKPHPVLRFCRKSDHEFFVAVEDAAPAVFHTEKGTYEFIRDEAFRHTADSTTDIKLDGFGNLFLVKGGELYYTDHYRDARPFSDFPVPEQAYAPFIKQIEVNGRPYEREGPAFQLNTIHLKYFERSIAVFFSLPGFISRDSTRFSWKADGALEEWVELPLSGTAIIPAVLDNLAPGSYVLRVRARVGAESWRPQELQLEIIIAPPVWHTWWFWTAVLGGGFLLGYLAVWLRVRFVRKQERLRSRHEKELLELEARALRAQMNPHFIFNCLNSIKALIQEGETDKSVTYLTTFSKLIRTLFHNADKKELSLYDELETCRLYLQLEAMRFGSSFSYTIETEEGIDLKSVFIPGMIIQPFLENAIWHGLVPKEGPGILKLAVHRKGDLIEMMVEDNGIGRQASLLNKNRGNALHQSKGLNLTQSRLELDNQLKKRKASLAYTDLKDRNGKAAGTKVVITIPAEQ